MFPRFVSFGFFVAPIAAATIACSHSDTRKVQTAAGAIADSSSRSATAPSTATPTSGADSARAGASAQNAPPNELGRIPVFEYHLIVDKNGLYERTQDGLKRDLETMYSRGYRPISMLSYRADS